MVGILSKTLSEVHPTLLTNGMGITNTHRRISLGFFPPNRKNPLVRKYRRKRANLNTNDQRSFQSLVDDFGSSVHEPSQFLNYINEDEEDLYYNDIEEGGELSRTVSLPSLVSETPDLSPPDTDWIIQEHERRYSSVYNSDNENDLADEPIKAQKQVYDSIASHKYRRRPSLISVSSRGTVPTIYQEINGTDGADVCLPEKITFREEAKVLSSFSFPLIFTFLLEQIFPMVCSLTVGHLGKNQLAAVSLASMTSNITLAVFEVPEKELIALTSQFLRVLIFGAPAYILFENLKRFLQAQGIFDAGIYVLTICAPLNIFVSYTLVWNKYIGIGFIGSAVAVVINFWLMFILLLLYTIYIDGKKCWGGFSKKAFTHWKDLGHLAFSGIIMLEAEELSYEILTLFSAYFGTSYLAAQSAVSTMAALLYMVPFAIGISASTRIANFIGAKRVDLAHNASEVGLVFSFGAGLTNCCVLFFGRNIIAHVFSRDDEVIDLMTGLLRLVAVVQIFDSLNAVAGSCLRGQGMQSLGSIVNLLGYYLFGIPLALILGWVFNMKLYGLWIGIGCAMLLIGLIEAYNVLYPNWDYILNYAEILKETEEDDDDDSYFTDSDDNDEEPTERSPLLD
ncbi:uncharacterized protein CGFF_05672 [Nakaseomyces glabratus]|nr:uncharacterized protein CGFF_04073 [Nakaseomyces glabratus]SLM16310.1 uncharacterized protein CGFF_05672 [Nakaseomyces glabratus]